MVGNQRKHACMSGAMARGHSPQRVVQTINSHLRAFPPLRAFRKAQGLQAPQHLGGGLAGQMLELMRQAIKRFFLRRRSCASRGIQRVHDEAKGALRRVWCTRAATHGNGGAAGGRARGCADTSAGRDVDCVDDVGWDADTAHLLSAARCRRRRGARGRLRPTRPPSWAPPAWGGPRRALPATSSFPSPPLTMRPLIPRLPWGARPARRAVPLWLLPCGRAGGRWPSPWARWRCGAAPVGGEGATPLPLFPPSCVPPPQRWRSSCDGTIAPRGGPAVRLLLPSSSRCGWRHARADYGAPDWAPSSSFSPRPSSFRWCRRQRRWGHGAGR